MEDTSPTKLIAIVDVASSKRTLTSLKKQPDLYAPAFASIEHGRTITLIGRTEDAFWVVPESDYGVSWINAADLKIEGDVCALAIVASSEAVPEVQPNEAPMMNNKPRTKLAATVTIQNSFYRDRAMVRRDTNPDSIPHTILPQGTAITLIARNADASWVVPERNDGIHWIDVSDLTIDGDVHSLEIIPAPEAIPQEHSQAQVTSQENNISALSGMQSQPVDNQETLEKKCKLIIICPLVYSTAASPEIFLDGRKVEGLQNGGKVNCKVEPGRHMLFVNWAGQRENLAIVIGEGISKTVKVINSHGLKLQEITEIPENSAPRNSSSPASPYQTQNIPSKTELSDTTKTWLIIGAIAIGIVVVIIIALVYDAMTLSDGEIKEAIANSYNINQSDILNLHVNTKRKCNLTDNLKSMGYEEYWWVDLKFDTRNGYHYPVDIFSSSETFIVRWNGKWEIEEPGSLLCF